MIMKSGSYNLLHAPSGIILHRLEKFPEPPCPFVPPWRKKRWRRHSTALGELYAGRWTLAVLPAVENFTQNEEFWFFEEYNLTFTTTIDTSNHQYVFLFCFSITQINMILLLLLSSAIPHFNLNVISLLTEITYKLQTGVI